jgi:hypothetical protein
MNGQETLSWVNKDDSRSQKEISDRSGRRTTKKWQNISQR